jgi:excisionase family DNA binding protein
MKTEITQPLLITVDETMAILRIGRTKLFHLIKREGLPVHRFGRRTLIDPDELKPWLAQRRKQAS